MPRQRRANWVSIRTLRQRPTPAGTTEDGHAVFEVRSVRLVLRDDASHFNRLVECSKCGREVMGAPVYSPDDLERSPSPVICRACVAASAVAEPWMPFPAAADEGPSGSGNGHPGTPAEPAPALAPVQADLDVSREALAARVTRVEDEVRQGLSALARAVDAERRTVAALAADVAAARAELESIPEREPDPSTLEELKVAVAALVEQRIGALEREVREVREEREELRVRLARLEQARARPPHATDLGLDGLEAQLRAAESRLAARAARPRIDHLIEPGER